MPVQQVVGESALRSELSATSNLVVVDFFADWCGPCKRIAPFVEQLSGRYPDVVFLKVKESESSDALHAFGVSKFPTFQFFIGGSKVHEFAGADPSALEQAVQQYKAQARPAFSGTGASLGGSVAADPRAARLARLGGGGAAAAAAAPTPAPSTAAAVAPAPAAPPVASGVGAGPVSVDAALQAALAASLATVPSGPAADAGGAAAAAAAAAAAPVAAIDAPAAAASALSVNQQLLAQLKDMGFPDVRAMKALHATSNASVEVAMDWLVAHQDDADIDVMPAVAAVPADGGSAATPPTAAPAGGVAKAFKCTDCSKMLRDSGAVELHAFRTKHSNFEESSEPIPELTAEEKKERVKQIREMLAAKRAQREKEEKEQQKADEKRRREMGKAMVKTREELAAAQRKREAEARRKEKEDQKRERERLLREIARDKAERAARRGEKAPPELVAAATGKAAPKTAKSALTPEQQADNAVDLLSKYRAGGDGLRALKTIRVYVNNALTKPDEDKFKRINLANDAFRKRVGSLRGGVALLKVAGFVKNELDNVLEVVERDEGRLRLVLEKAEAGIKKLDA